MTRIIHKIIYHLTVVLTITSLKVIVYYIDTARTDVNVVYYARCFASGT